MPKLDKNSNRRNQAGEGKTMARKKSAPRKGREVEVKQAPFHGNLHSEHPHDPFRNIFGDSSSKFEF